MYSLRLKLQEEASIGCLFPHDQGMLFVCLAQLSTIKSILHLEIGV
jgi:hypothetical protein